MVCTYQDDYIPDNNIILQEILCHILEYVFNLSYVYNDCLKVSIFSVVSL